MNDNTDDFFDYNVFSFYDDIFIEKYALLSAMWTKLAHIGRCKIHISQDEVFFRVFSDEKGRCHTIRSYMESNLHVFTFEK